MSLRRFAQENRMQTVESSRHSPRTPRTSNIYRSPVTSPSVSATIPFDWEAARATRRPPVTPTNGHARQGRQSMGTPKTPRKGVVRRQSMAQRIIDYPSNLYMKLTMLQENFPLPSAKTSAQCVGGFLHLVHFYARMYQQTASWYYETAWLDWADVVNFLLVGTAFINALYLFTRIKVYRLHRQVDRVASPSARFVESDVDINHPEPPSMLAQMLSFLGTAWSVSWRFLLGMSKVEPAVPSSGTQVQQLDVWNPSDLELSLFCIYSPIHSLLWMTISSANWVLPLIIMGALYFQLNTLCDAFKVRLKDREIIAAQVMSEYDQIYVNPRVHPSRSDAAVMTHQSEVVDPWVD